MSDTRLSDNLSNGFLPQAALLHPEPTAMGLWDIGSGSGVTRPETAAAEAPDQLVLVRLHGQPVAVLHLEEPAGAESRSEMLAAVWATAALAITDHVERFGCMQIPASESALDAGSRAAEGTCSCQTPARPPGTAAVVVCTTGREAALTRCLESLERMRHDDFEVILVDNRPSVPASKAVAERFASKINLTYVAEHRAGTSRARNAGIAATDATYIAFADDDVVLDDQWLPRMLEPFCDQAVNAVTGLVLPLTLVTAVQKRFEQYAGFGKGVVPEQYDLGDQQATDRFMYPYFGGVFGSGNSMAFRRDALLKIGGFDPALGPATPTGAGEDIAVFTDVILAGGRIAYEPRAVCWHEHRGDEAALNAQVRNYGIGLTAVFCRYLIKDWRFSATIVKSIPVTVAIVLKRRRQRSDAVVPVDLLSLEAGARWLGPWRYLKSRLQLKRG
jgi:GT2 family glycosyltransferase